MATRSALRASCLASCIAAIVFAAGCGRDPLGELIAQLESPTVETRREAARALGKTKDLDNRAIGALAEAIADEDPDVRRMSAVALGHAGSSAAQAIPALQSALQDSNVSVQRAAALAILRIEPQNPSCVPVLVRALRAADGRLMLEVGGMGPAGAWAVPTLIELLSHESDKVRALAAQTLGRIGPAARAAMPALQLAARDANLAVHDAAAAALDSIRP